MKPSIKKRKIGSTYGYNLSSYQCTECTMVVTIQHVPMLQSYLKLYYTV